MSDNIFIFDLDSTIMQVEIMPELAKRINKSIELRSLTEKAIQNELPHKESLIERIKLLTEINISEVREIVHSIPLNTKIVEFIKENIDRCYIVTGNIDIWTHDLLTDLGFIDHCFSSKAQIKNNKLDNIISIVDKAAVISQFVAPVVAIGVGNNDAEMISMAKVGIGYGGNRNVSSSVLESATHAIYEEGKLCQFLKRLL